MTDVGGFEACHEARAWSEDEFSAFLRALGGVFNWMFMHVPHGLYGSLTRMLQFTLEDTHHASDRNCPNCRHLSELRYETASSSNLGIRTEHTTLTATCPNVMSWKNVYPDEMLSPPCGDDSGQHLHFARRDDG